MSRAEDSLVICEACGAPHRWLRLQPGKRARCVRCDAILGRGHRLELQSVLALTVSALIVFLIAITSNVISLRLRGAVVSTTLPAAVVSAWQEGQPLVAIAAALTALVAPAVFIALRLYVLLPLSVGQKPRGFAWCVRGLHQAGRWNMVEVFTVGALLSLVRLAGVAEASPGPALYALGALTVLFAAIESAGLKHLWWRVE